MRKLFAVGVLPLGGEGGPRRDSLAAFRRRAARNLPSRPGPTSQAAFHLDLKNLSAQRKEADPKGPASLQRNARRCPTLPRGLPRSTIGAEGLNFRVRDGTGCFPLAMAAATLWRYQPWFPAVFREPHSGREPPDRSGDTCNVCSVCQALGLLVPV